MESFNTGTYDMYKDISARTNGEIYIGVIGAVRTGKSSFIKRFMELMVLPFMEDENSRQRAVDEMPQAAQGKTIMTTEPKFIPKDAAKIRLGEDTEVKVRLIDCVGYMVEGATGHLENGVERMVKTPWFEEEIPFTKAAEVGTRKVINDHATIGIVVTADGSFTDIPRENYVKGEEETIKELQRIGKPFVMVLNSVKPYSEETAQLAKELEEKYEVSVFFRLYMYTALAPLPLASFAGESTQSVGISFIKSYVGVCLEGAVIVLACVIYAAFVSTPTVSGGEATTMVWSYLTEIIFNMLVLVGLIKGSDRIIHEMMGL